MTGISAMKFNKNEGALITDEEVGMGRMTAPIANKLHVFAIREGDNKTIGLAGGTGNGIILDDVGTQIASELPRSMDRYSAERLAGLVSYKLNEYRQRMIEGYFRSKWGVSFQDYVTGTVVMPGGERQPMDKDFKKKIDTVFDGTPDRPNEPYAGFVLVAADKEGVKLFYCDTSSHAPYPYLGTYICQGSGKSTTEPLLLTFIESKTRLDRGDIDPIEGIAELIYATEMAKLFSPGVGGMSYIAAVRDMQVFQPGEDESDLAAKIVRAHKKGLLPTEFMRNAIEGIVYKDAKYDALRPATVEAAGANRKNMERMLERLRV